MRTSRISEKQSVMFFSIKKRFPKRFKFTLVISLALAIVGIYPASADWVEFGSSPVDTSNSKLVSKAYDIERVSFSISNTEAEYYNFFLHFTNPVSNALFADRSSFAAILIDTNNDGVEDYSIDTNYDHVYKGTQFHAARMVDRRTNDLPLLDNCSAQTWSNMDRKVAWIGFRAKKTCIPFGNSFSIVGYSDFKSGDNADYDYAPNEWWQVTPGLSSNQIPADCKKYDLETFFSTNYYPGWTWTSAGVPKTVTWAMVDGPVGKNPPTIAGERTIRSFTPEQKSWLRTAINSWDIASEALSFTEVDALNNPKILIGIMEGEHRWRIYGITTDGPMNEAWIKVNGNDAALTNRDGFISTMQGYIGNILNLGNLRPTKNIESVMESPNDFINGREVLSDLDISLIRQINGESTCKGSWSPELLVAVADSREAEAKAKAEAEAKKVTITCTKGKLSKKVSGTNPKCPKGFVKSK